MKCTLKAPYGGKWRLKMSKKYPVFTEENFEHMFQKYVHFKKGYGRCMKVRKPRNNVEFAEMTKGMYGKPLHMLRASIGYYEVKEDHRGGYADYPLMKLWEQKCGQYDGVKVALNTAFGALGTGGTARTAYGSYKVVSHRDRIRIGNFWQ